MDDRAAGQGPSLGTRRTQVHREPHPVQSLARWRTGAVRLHLRLARPDGPQGAVRAEQLACGPLPREVRCVARPRADQARPKRGPVRRLPVRPNAGRRQRPARVQRLSRDRAAPFFWTSDVQGAHGWITGSETCSIFSQPFCSPSSPQSADLAVLAQDASRITATTVKVDGAATTCGSAGSACGFSIAPDPQSFLWWFSFKQEGVHHIELSATDADPSPAGCTVCGPHTAVSAYDVKLDLSDPSTGLTVTPATPDGTEGWYRTAPVLLTFTGADTPSASGVDRIDYHIEPPLPMEFDAEGERIARSSDGFTRFSIGEDPLKIDADGNYTISYLAVDKAGRHSARQAANVKLDPNAA